MDALTIFAFGFLCFVVFLVVFWIVAEVSDYKDRQRHRAKCEMCGYYVPETDIRISKIEDYEYYECKNCRAK